MILLSILKIIHNTRHAANALIRLLLLSVAFTALNTVAAGHSISLNDRSSPELIGRARSFIETDTLLDKAVEALSIVANRYYSNPTDSEARHHATEAMYELGNIYSFRLFDFPKAYTNYSTARMIAEEDNDDYNLSRILIRLGNLYIVSGLQNERNCKTSNNLLLTALDRAMKSRNEETIARITLNMSTMRAGKKNWGDYDEAVKKIREYNFEKDSSREYSLNIINGMNAYFKGDYAEAESSLNEALSAAPAENFSERYVYGTMYLLQYVFDRSGETEKEEKIIKKRLDLTKKLSLTDYELYTYAHLRDFYERNGDSDSVKKYKMLYLSLKEEMENETGLDKIGNMEMLRQMEKINEEARQLSIQRMKGRRNLTVMTAVATVVFILLLAVGIMYINLKRNHRFLFNRNRELLNLQQQYRLLVREENKADESEGMALEQGGARIQHPDEAITTIFSRILKVMETSRDIYNIGFGIDTLTAMVHESQNNVSKAINQCGGTNFHQFLNSYRIREACRLMQISDPKVTTVESIAETSGFKSRTYFASLFKKSTGLTPSEYWKLSRERSRTSAHDDD